jgi:glucose-1-phosphate cytidylyltransferase
MQTVILCGGLGSRLAEETETKPKPMVEIGGKPILWHIMKIYSHYGLNDFIICLGYKGYQIKEYFNNFLIHNNDFTINMKDNSISYHSNKEKNNWKITLVDTGKNTLTGGRLKRVAKFINKKDFCFTYGDGLGDINLKKLISFHKSNKKLATVTAVKSPARFGVLNIEKNIVKNFEEKPKSNSVLINGGFFVLSEKVLDYIKDDSSIWEQEPLENLVKEKQLISYAHDGFWYSMDTMRDKRYLEELWKQKKAPWKIWV